ncbi:4'-phosphopantetheinyl transferase family protein [Paenibacillus dendritiformis]|uniref:4'-phosphopantetheinyl transferase family protein n=1 Tax=Paenibacillus dendritiformis TaxID=130049 RepID=UPI0015619480|nr:4'-phosphopantetheinyl transferase superfamily protein [Paenibacillus dendritiformis]NRF98099.1 4'-phosphopantetheinyl transferase superfamily protein [Paenibacillus dendritiformis]
MGTDKLRAGGGRAWANEPSAMSRALNTSSNTRSLRAQEQNMMREGRMRLTGIVREEALLTNSKGDGNRQIGIFAMRVPEAMEQATLQQLLRLLPPDRQDKINRFRHQADACRSLLGEVLVRKIIGERTGLPNSRIRFQYNRYGKPELASEHRLFFNISHSGEWIACAVHDTEVGIDVEQIKPIDLSVARRFFSAEEVEQLEKEPPEGRLKLFYDLWTLKESYVKLRGQGLSIPLDSFSVHKSDQGECCLRSPADAAPRFFFKQYHLDDEYCLSLCAVEPAFPADIIRCEYPAFLSELSADAHFCR